MKKKGLLILAIILLFPVTVLARSKTSCDYGLLSKLKNLANNVDVTYTYKINNEDAYFDITLANIQSDMYFIDNYTGRTYYYNDTNNGSITLNDYPSGTVGYTFYSNNNDCFDEKLVVKNVNLPYYNSFYNYVECLGIEEYKFCQKWVKTNGDYYVFLDNVTEYKNSLRQTENNEYVIKENFITKIINFYTNNFYIILPILVVIISLIVYLEKYIKHRLNRFDI